jgi:hypothetical protein
MFQLGCWTAFGTAVLHLLAHLFAPGGLSAESAEPLRALPPPFVFLVPGSRQPHFTGTVSAFSLVLPLLLTTIGAAGLAVLRYGHRDDALLRGVSRSFALGTAGLLLLSIGEFFSLQTFAISLVAMCFGLASVPQE